MVAKDRSATTVESMDTSRGTVQNHQEAKGIRKEKDMENQVAKDIREKVMHLTTLIITSDPLRDMDRRVVEKVPGVDAGYVEAIISKKIVQEIKGKEEDSGRWMDGENKKDKQITQEPSLWHA